VREDLAREDQPSLRASNRRHCISSEAAPQTDEEESSMKAAGSAATAPPLSRRRKIVFAIVTLVIVTIIVAGALMATDVWLHARLQRFSGVNVWGYRGPRAGRKGPGELRVAVLGGSSAFGYGIRWDEAIPAALQRVLAVKRREAGEGRVSVINLAYNNEGAYSFKFTLQDYAYLDYDMVSLHSGYNDLIPDPGVNESVYRHDSPVFRATGYMPILPLFLREKTSSWLSGDIEAGYRDARGERVTVFKPGLARAATASALHAVAAIGASLDRQFGRLAAESPRRATESPLAEDPPRGCPHPWANYCRGLFEGIDYALAHGKRVLVVTEPYLASAARPLHVYQQRVMAEAVQRTYGTNPRVKYVNAGDTVNLSDPAYGYDSMHLTPAGSVVVARQLADPLLELSRRGDNRRGDNR
jgi:hypothetical protein